MKVLYFTFWICLILLVYPYIIYPAVLFIFSKLKKPDFSPERTRENLPSVTFIISAYNEENVIWEKLDNTFTIDYPMDKLEVLVVSDASTDRTDDIVKKRSLKNPNMKLVRQQQRKGKTLGLNLALKQASGEIVVFSDANAIYDRNSIIELINYFQDPRVGYVMGAALYNEDKDSAVTESEGLYWKFELFLKKLETKFYSVVGGDGAIYAIRRELFWNLDEDDINDFVNPLQIIAKGYRGVFNPKAICFEDAANDFRKEFKRKRRIVNRSWRAVKKYINWFDFKKHYQFLFELFSHKVIRWFSLPILLVAFLSNFGIVLLSSGPFYVVIFLGQIGFGILTLLGIYFNQINKNMPKVVYLSFYYFFIHSAALLGIIDEARGVRYATWDHIRDSRQK